MWARCRAGHWCAEGLDWQEIFESEDEAVIVPRHAFDESKQIPLLEQGPGLIYVTVQEGKTLKNRLHTDLAPSPNDDQPAELARLEGLGATRVNVGQDELNATWVVLADPEVNEFCVLSPEAEPLREVTR